MINAKLIEKEDNVIVAIYDIKKGEEVEYLQKNGEINKFEVLDDIKMFHKIAIEDIKKGEKIIKYGEHMGEASKDIKKGEHVHTQNVNSVREEL
ncbi:MAG: UxaA family hydrolase [Clostridioides sp.]|jgi:altronate dehydratase|nr:UxaA family hydrolase [Clostridioides sp.]